MTMKVNKETWQTSQVVSESLKHVSRTRRNDATCILLILNDLMWRPLLATRAFLTW
jgi:hypothetical protein